MRRLSSGIPCKELMPKAVEGLGFVVSTLLHGGRISPRTMRGRRRPWEYHTATLMGRDDKVNVVNTKQGAEIRSES